MLLTYQQNVLNLPRSAENLTQIGIVQLNGAIDQNVCKPKNLIFLCSKIMHVIAKCVIPRCGDIPFLIFFLQIVNFKQICKQKNMNTQNAFKMESSDLKRLVYLSRIMCQTS